MGIDIAVDKELVEEAKRITGVSGNSAAVEQVLRRLFDGRKKHKDLLDLAGEIEFFEGYDPKTLRTTRHDAD